MQNSARFSKGSVLVRSYSMGRVLKPTAGLYQRKAAAQQASRRRATYRLGNNGEPAEQNPMTA